MVVLRGSGRCRSDRDSERQLPVVILRYGLHRRHNRDGQRQFFEINLFGSGDGGDSSYRETKLLGVKLIRAVAVAAMVIGSPVSV